MKEDARSPFLLSDVKTADLRHIRAQHAQDTPSFILKDVEDFSLQQSLPLRDIILKKVKQQRL